MDEPFDFETLLPRALIDANLLQLQRTLEEAEDLTPDFSPRYQRSRLRMLNDPAGWARRRGRPLWEKTLRGAACLLLLCALALGSLMAVSPTVRAAVRSWFREITSDGVIYRPTQWKESELPPSWRPGWVPEGWTLRELIAAEEGISWMLKKELPELGYTGTMTCSCYTTGNSGIGSHADSDWTYEPARVQGVSADYCKNEYNHMLVWEGEDGSLFLVSGGRDSVDRQTLQRVAESMAYYDASRVRYDVSWMPEGSKELSRWEQTGVGQMEWMVGGEFLTFLFVTDPPVAPAEPERAWEEAEVHGLPARYWPCQVPEEKLQGVEVSDVGEVTITAGVQYGVEDSAALLWEDPETNTLFLLRGVLDREVMLQIAEGVAETEAS